MEILVTHPPARVLVLGAGFIGARLVRDLMDRGSDVVVLSRRHPSGFAATLLEGSEVLTGDAGVLDTIAGALDGVDHVVFGLSSLMPGEADQNPELDMSLTLRPLLKLLDQLASGPRLPLTFLSSGGTVYGRPAVFPTPEDAPTDPLSSYGITKLTGEKYVLRYSALNSASVRVLRISNAYGPGQVSRRGQGVIAAALEHCLSGNHFTAFGDGSVARDFVHVEDVSAAIADLMGLSGGPAVVNIGSGSSVDLDEVLQLAQEVSGYPLKIKRVPGRAFDVPRVQLDIRRVQSMIDFIPRSLRDGMTDTWQHLTAEVAAGVRPVTLAAVTRDR